MKIEEKIELNKLIKSYEGQNSFLVSLKKSLASKYCQKEELNGKQYKVLSEKQYLAAKDILTIV
jgi:hypothetical protein